MPTSKRDWNQKIRGLGKLEYTSGPGQRPNGRLSKFGVPWVRLAVGNTYQNTSTVCILAPSLYGVGGPDQDAWMENSVKTPGWTVNTPNR